MEQSQNINQNQSNSIIIDFEQIFLSEENKEKFLILKRMIEAYSFVSIISRCGIKKLLDFFENFSFLSQEEKEKLYLFPRRTSIFYAFNSGYIYNVSSNHLDFKSIQEIISKANFSFSIINQVVDGCEITLHIKQEKPSQSFFFKEIEVALSQLQDYEIRVKSNTEISISKRCKNNCACFNSIFKELNITKSYFWCKNCDHSIIENISILR